MESNNVATVFFGWASTVGTIILAFIPIFMLVIMFRTKDNSRVTYLLFIVTIFSNFIWFMYGFIVSSDPFIVTNGFSGTLHVIYLICFIFTLHFSLSIRIVISIGLGLIVGLALFFSLFYLDAKDKQVYGTLAVIANCFLFIGPIQNIMSTFKEKDSSYIPIEIVIALLVNSILRLGYGICLENDVNIILPNVFGLVLMLFESGVWCYFYFNRGDNDIQKQQTKTDEDSLPYEKDEAEDKPLII